MLYLRPDFASTLTPNEQRFSHLFALTGIVYRHHAGRRTLKFQHQGKDFFLKTHAGVGWKEIFKNLVQWRLPVVSARPEWQALHRLKDLNINTVTPVAYGSVGCNPATRQSLLITEALADSVTLEELLLRSPAPSVTLKRSLLTKLAEIARMMHDNGINHRDFYLCHFRVPVSHLQEEAPVQSPPIYVMDLHRAQVRRRCPRERWIVKDLGGLYFSSIGLGLNRQDRFRFIRAYSAQSLRHALRARGSFWDKVSTRAWRMYRKHHTAD